MKHMLTCTHLLDPCSDIIQYSGSAGHPPQGPTGWLTLTLALPQSHLGVKIPNMLQNSSEPRANGSQAIHDNDSY